MIRKLVLAALFASLVAASESAEAQRSSRRPSRTATTPSISISPYAGYMAFGNLVEGPLETRLTNSSAPVFGAQVNLPLGTTLSIVGNVAYSEPDLRFGVPILGGINFGKSKVLMYDAGFQFNAPARYGERTITPFIQVGAGGMNYDTQVAGLSRKATNIAFNAGLGVDLPLAQNLGLRVFAKDYIGKFDVNEATGVDYEAKTSHNIALSAGLKLSF